MVDGLRVCAATVRPRVDGRVGTARAAAVGCGLREGDDCWWSAPGRARWRPPGVPGLRAWPVRRGTQLPAPPCTLYSTANGLEGGRPVRSLPELPVQVCLSVPPLRGAGGPFWLRSPRATTPGPGPTAEPTARVPPPRRRRRAGATPAATTSSPPRRRSARTRSTSTSPAAARSRPWLPR